MDATIASGAGFAGGFLGARYGLALTPGTRALGGNFAYQVRNCYNPTFGKVDIVTKIPNIGSAAVSGFVSGSTELGGSYVLDEIFGGSESEGNCLPCEN